MVHRPLIRWLLAGAALTVSLSTGAVAASTDAGGTIVRYFAGRVADAGGIDLDALRITLRIRCDDPKTGDCGSNVYDAELSNGAVRFDGVSFALSDGDYVSDGWGRYFKATLRFESDGDAVFNDLSVYGWERRPGNDLEYVWSTLETYLRDMTFHAVEAGTTLKLSYQGDAGGTVVASDKSQIQVVYNRQLLADGEKQNAAVWIRFDHREPLEGIELSLPPMVLVYNGNAATSAKPIDSAYILVAVAHGPFTLDGGKHDGAQTAFAGEYAETVDAMLAGHASAAKLSVTLSQQIAK